MNIALYFGSFNPIHNGHLHVAHQVLEQQQSDEVWLVVSPQNPFKENNELAAQEQRLRMAQLAIAGEKNLHVCDVEFMLPKPSYTIDTIRVLSARHPEHTFRLIIGEDNLGGFNRWKEFDALLSLVEVIVYPRTNATPSLPGELQAYQNRFHFLAGELIAISATDIRNNIRHAAPIQGLTPAAVEQYIEDNGLYR